MEDCLNEIIARYWFDLYTFKDDPRRLYMILTQQPLWLFKDHAAQKYGLDPNISDKEFCQSIVRHCDFLKEHIETFENNINIYTDYKKSIPTYGAILLNKQMDKILLTTDYLEKLGFPKGKINQGENQASCAIREMFEETGFDITELLNEKEYIFLEGIDDKYLKLFVIPNIDETIEFKPTVPLEVKEVKFYSIKEIEKKCRKQTKTVVLALKLLIGAIQAWIRKKKKHRIFYHSSIKIAEKQVKFDITLSHETDTKLQWHNEKSFKDEIFLYKGCFAHYILKQYTKAKQYYKNAIMTNMSEDAVQCLLNLKISNSDSLFSCMTCLDKYKNILGSDLFKKLEFNIKLCYQPIPQDNFNNLILIYPISPKVKRYFSDYPELDIRRLLKFDPSIIRVLKVYVSENESEYPTNFVTRSTGEPPFYIAEYMHSVENSLIWDDQRLDFYYYSKSTNEVSINQKSYTKWIDQEDPKFTIFPDDLFWTGKMLQSMSDKMLEGINFTNEPYEDDDEENVINFEENQPKIKKNEKEWEFDKWENFEFDKSIYEIKSADI